MAEGTVTFFAEKLSNLILQEASVFGEVEGQIKLLRDELEWMRLFLRDADSKGVYDERVKLWVNQIRSATHEAEDVIEEFILNMDHRKQRLNTLKFLPTCVGMVDKVHFIHELDSRVKDINAKIGAIMANRSKYGLEDLTASSSSTADQVVSHKERRAPVVEESVVVGIDDGAKKVKQMLMKEETVGRSVVSIFGMGGLGKTTLAKKVYNQRDVHGHFDCKAWVYVSQEFRAREILLAIALQVMSLSDEEKKEMGEDELGKKLCGYLGEKKYLVVMDDVWSSEVWSRLQPHFPDQAKDGSIVLITTRNKEIALHATYSEEFIYELRHMNDDESWQLFLKKAFRGTGTTTLALTTELKELGNKIVTKCEGLPLAIVVLGSLLSTKEKTEQSWEKMIASIEWHLDQGPDSCMRILALSYNDLPYYLKSCFLYCGIFPEDSEIDAWHLIKLWMAKGFIQRRGKERLEDIAEDYMHELIHRSLIQVSDRRQNGIVKSCRMHDLLRELAVKQAKDANFFEVHENMDSTFPISIRRLVIHQNIINHDISQCLHKSSSQLRTLISFSGTIGKKSWGSLQEHIKLLTVLNLSNKEVDVHVLPRDIGQLIHLKFLCIKGYGSHVKLPSSINRLVNLQSLDLGANDCNIPHSIWKLKKLRHLECPFSKVSSQSQINKRVNDYLGVEQLTNLQTLALNGGSWLEGDGLGKLTQLRSLELSKHSTSYLKTEFFESIAKLTVLEILDFSFTEGHTKKTLVNRLRLVWEKKNVTIDHHNKTLLPGLMPFSNHAYLYDLSLFGMLENLPKQIEFYPPKLLRLALHGCNLTDDPMMILKKLPSLRILVLCFDAYVREKMVCSSGGFLQLERLELFYFSELEELIVERGAMSSLKTLEIGYCDKMEKLPHGLLEQTNLEKLSLQGSSCHKSIKEIEEAGGEDWDKLRKIMC